MHWSEICTHTHTHAYSEECSERTGKLNQHALVRQLFSRDNNTVITCEIEQKNIKKKNKLKRLEIEIERTDLEASVRTQLDRKIGLALTPRTRMAENISIFKFKTKVCQD